MTQALERTYELGEKFPLFPNPQFRIRGLAVAAGETPSSRRTDSSGREYLIDPTEEMTTEVDTHSDFGLNLPILGKTTPFRGSAYNPVITSEADTNIFMITVHSEMEHWGERRDTALRPLYYTETSLAVLSRLGLVIEQPEEIAAALPTVKINSPVHPIYGDFRRRLPRMDNPQDYFKDYKPDDRYTNYLTVPRTTDLTTFQAQFVLI
jgi:hypothetical protein